MSVEVSTLLMALLHSPHRLEGRSQLVREDRRLLPGGEVPALFCHVEVAEARVGLLCPAPRGLPDLPGERGEADGNRDRRRSFARRDYLRARQCVLPVRPGGRGSGARQPVQRDVVDDVIAGETARWLPVDERAGDLVVAVRVVVE